MSHRGLSYRQFHDFCEYMVRQIPAPYQAVLTSVHEEHHQRAVIVQLRTYARFPQIAVAMLEAALTHELPGGLCAIVHHAYDTSPEYPLEPKAPPKVFRPRKPGTLSDEELRSKVEKLCGG